MKSTATAIDLSKEPDFALGAMTARPSILEIQCGDRTGQIQPKIMKVLVLLSRSRGKVVSREEFSVQCWDGANVTVDALNRAASILRQELREIGCDVQIDTIPRVGYCLADPGEVQAVPAGRMDWQAAERMLRRSRRRWAAPAGFALTAGLAALTLGFATSGNHRNPRSPEPAQYQSLAVLPFTDLSQSGDLAYLAAGVAEEFRIALASADNGVRVSARASSSSLAGTNLSPSAVADALNVDAFLEGSIMEIDQRKRLSLSLVDPATGHSIWDRSFDFSIESMDEIQAIVVSQVFEAINQTPAGPSAVPGAPMLGADDNEQFLKANYFLSLGDTRSLALAQQHYLQLIDAAPDFAPGYARLVAASLASEHQWQHKQARTYLDRAIELDPWGRETLLAEQQFNDHMRFDGMSDKWLSRPNEPRRERALDYGARLRTLVVQSRYREAEALADEILEHDPIGVETNAYLARVLARRGKPQQAISRIDQALRYHPNSLELRFWRVNALSEAGDFSGCFGELVTMLENAPEDLRTRYFLSLLLGEVGLGDEALALAPAPLLRLQAMHATGQDRALAALISAEMAKSPPTEVRARMNLLLHDLQGARPWLERMYERGMPSNFVEHPSDYKPYLALARRQSGQDAAAAALDEEILAEIERQTRNGDESIVLFAPFKAFAAAARNDRAELFDLIDQSAAGGYILYGLDDPIFDHLRNDPEFSARYASFRKIRDAQRRSLVDAGYVERVRQVLAIDQNPFPEPL